MQRLTKKLSSKRFTVDQHAVAIEDDEIEHGLAIPCRAQTCTVVLLGQSSAPSAAIVRRNAVSAVAEDTVPLYGAGEIERILGHGGSTGPAVTGISIDSRTLERGDLFVALAGDDPRYHGAGGGGRDGHDFVAAAAAAGAAAALVATPLQVDLPQIVVADPFDALWSLARAARARLAEDVPVFAITGSSGKTTARGLLSAALEVVAGPTHASIGSLNNYIGVPLSLARTPRHVRSAVYEIGTNSHGEIGPLSVLVRPTVSVLINVLPVHLEGLGSLAGVRQEKLKIAEGLEASGCLVLHDAIAPPERPRHRTLRFGRTDVADIRLDDHDASVTVHLPGGATVSHERLADGPHRRSTACAVIGALAAAGLDPAPALAAIAATEPPRGRGRRTLHGGVHVIDDAYNANPESVRQALAGALEGPEGPRVAVLGDMLERGEASAALHAELADACVGFDKVFCVGALMRALYENLPHAQRGGWTADAAALSRAALLDAAPSGAVVLVKGSNRIFWHAGTVQALCAALEARAREVD